MKLELKHLANYLPYELKCVCEGYGVMKLSSVDFVDIEFPVWFKTRNYNSQDFNYEKLMSEGIIGKGFRLSEIKPLLRPLSDLTKPCLEGGKVPLIELCKIAYDNHKNFRQRGNVIEILSGEYALYNFYWQKNGFVTIHISDKMARVIPNQIDLFSYLFEKHFDIYNLIQNGLAIDINTIKEEI